MKKNVLLIMILLLLVSCGKKDNPNSVYIYLWSNYLPVEIYKDFEKETGIKVIEDTYATNEEMFTKLKAGGDGYDLVMPSSDFLEIMMAEDMLSKLDKTKISNYEDIDKSIRTKLHYFDPNNDYELPYIIVPTVIALHKEFVKDYPKDYTIFEREDLKGRMVLLDDMREVFSAALGMNGYLQDENDEKIIKEAKDTILKWKRNIAKFDSEYYTKGFGSKEFWVVQGYADGILASVPEKDRDSVDIFIPEKGSFSALDSFVILKNAKHKDNAHKFLEFIVRPDNYAKITDYLEIPALSEKANKIKEVESTFEIKDLENVQILKNIGDTVDLQNKYWEEISVSN